MRKLIVASTLGAALLFGTISVVAPQASLAKPTCPDTWTGNKCEYFQDGYKQGKQDRKANMSMAYQRHAGMYDSRFEEAFSVGYEAGWKGETYGSSATQASASLPKCPDTWTGNKCEYFRDGYKQGQQDRKANMSMAYQRHSGMYDSRFEEAFSVGYEAGWKGESH